MRRNTALPVDEHRNRQMPQIGFAIGEETLELTCYQALQRDGQNDAIHISRLLQITTGRG
jgi:hypothetical protein